MSEGGWQGQGGGNSTLILTVKACGSIPCPGCRCESGMAEKDFVSTLPIWLIFWNNNPVCIWSLLALPPLCVCQQAGNTWQWLSTPMHSRDSLWAVGHIYERVASLFHHAPGCTCYTTLKCDLFTLRGPEWLDKSRVKCNAAQITALCYSEPGRRSMGAAWVFPCKTPWILMHSQIYHKWWTWKCVKTAAPPQVRRNEEKYIYFSSFFPLSMSAVFFSTHRKRKMPQVIAFVQEGALPPKKLFCRQLYEN